MIQTLKQFKHNLCNPQHNGDVFYTVLDGDVLKYEVLRKTKEGYIVYDSKQDAPLVFKAEHLNKHYFDEPKKAIEHAIELLNGYSKRVTDDKVKLLDHLEDECK